MATRSKKMDENIKIVTTDVSFETYKLLKIQAIQKNMGFGEYLKDILEKHVKGKKIDKSETIETEEVF